METELAQTDIQPIPETMLRPVFVRAAASQADTHHIHDEKAVEITSQLEYHLSPSKHGHTADQEILARTILLDRMVEEFLAEHPNTVVLNMACGLDTRCCRMADKYGHWYNLDSPEAMEIRSRFFPAMEHVTDLSVSLSDRRWGKKIVQTQEPVLVILEDLTMHLEETEVQQLFAAIRSRFTHCTVFVETMSPRAVAKEQPAGDEPSNFKWGVKSGSAMQSLIPAFRSVRDVSLVEGRKVLSPIYNVIGALGSVRSSAGKILVFEK